MPASVIGVLVSVLSLMNFNTIGCATESLSILRQAVIDTAIHAHGLMAEPMDGSHQTFLPDVSVKAWSSWSDAQRSRWFITRGDERTSGHESTGVWFNLNWRFPQLSRSRRALINLETAIRRRQRIELRRRIGRLFDAWSGTEVSALEAQKISALLDAHTDFQFGEMVKKKEGCSCALPLLAW